MLNLSNSSPSILSSTSEIRNSEISDSDQHTSWPERRVQASPVEQHGPDYCLKRQLDDVQIELQKKLVENSNFARLVLLPRGIVAGQQKSRLAIRHFFQPESAKAHRPTGPIQFILRLLDCWRLERTDAINLLGFEETESEFVFEVLEGNESLRGRDAKDRLSHLLSIRKSLHGFFRDLETENDWLRETQPLLDGQTPMNLLLGGSMEDILLVREYVDSMVGK